MLEFLSRIERQEKQLDKLFPVESDRGHSDTAEFDSPWLEDPLPLGAFMADVMGLPLWPQQQADLESFLGHTSEDTKALFTQSPPTPYNCGALIWGKGCLGPDERLTDAATNQTKTVAEWAALGRSLLLPSWDGNSVVLRLTSPVYLKGRATLYRVTLADGRSFTATEEHRCLSPEGWLPLGSFRVGHTRLLTTPLGSNVQTTDWRLDNQASPGGKNLYALTDAARDRCAHEWLAALMPHSSKACLFCQSSAWGCGCEFCREDFPAFHENNAVLDAQTDQGSPVDYRLLPHLCDGQLHEVLGIGLAFAPSPSDALSRSLHDWRWDDCHVAPSLTHNPICLSSCLRWVDTSREVVHGGASLLPCESNACVWFLPNSRIADAIPFGWLPVHTCQPSPSDARVESNTALVAPLSNVPYSFPHFSEIVDIKGLGESDYYDLTVSGTHCYFDSQGICHHNSGKDLVSSSMLAWFIHILFCLRSPQQFLELEPSEAIDIALASPTLRQTRRITFAKLKNRLKGWGWLKERFYDLGIDDPDRYLKRATEAADYIELPNNIRIHNIPLIAASAEGFNMLAFILSEFAAMESDATSETASEVLNSFMSSGKTRYRRAWKGFLASFPRSLNDPQEKIVEQYESGLFPELFVVRRPTWEVHPHRKFEDFASDFERNPEDAWAKYGARPRAAVEAYFRSPDLIVKHASGGDLTLFQKHFRHRSAAQQQWLSDRLPSPIIERDMIGDVTLNDYGFPRLHEWFKGKPGVEYWAHCDIGLSRDSTGFAIGHLQDTGAGYLPVIDLSFRWKASHFTGFGEIRRFSWRYDAKTHTCTYGDEYLENIQAAEIDLKTVTDFVLWLSAMRGFAIAGFSCDGFNSAQLLQTLMQFDIPTRLHVVDKGDYDELKAAIYTRQIQYWCDRPLFHELSKLIIKGGKVEAPRTKTDSDSVSTDSHKDEADAVARVASVLNKLVATQTDFVQLPDPDEQLDSDAAESDEGEIAAPTGEYSETQKLLLNEFFT